jgi:hypothetical protein
MAGRRTWCWAGSGTRRQTRHCRARRSAAEGLLVAEVPALIDGFLRALCGIANGMYSEGGMSCTYHQRVPLPRERPAGGPSEDALLARFFDVALGNYGVREPATRGHLVSELRRVVREASGADLVAAGVDEDPGEGYSCTLTLWWRSAGGGLDSAELFWSLD